MERSDFFQIAVKLLLPFSKSSKTAPLLVVLTRTQEGCSLKKSNEQHKILAGLFCCHSLWFLKFCQNVEQYKKRERTSEQKSIAKSFELSMYKVLMKISLREILRVDFELSSSIALIALYSI